MAKQDEMFLVFVGGPLDGKRRYPDSTIVAQQSTRYYANDKNGVLHEYTVAWDLGRADHVGLVRRKAKPVSSEGQDV